MPAILGMFVGGAVAWMAYSAFFAGADNGFTTPVAFFLKRLAATVVCAFAGGLAAESHFAPIEATSAPNSRPMAETLKPAVVAIPARNERTAPPPTEERPPSELRVEAAEPPAPLASNSEPTREVAMQQSPRVLDLAAIDCHRPVADYQTLVCEDPPLRQQEGRILKRMSARLASASSDAEAKEMHSRFLAFRNALAGCVYKICIETAYADLEKELDH